MGFGHSLQEQSRIFTAISTSPAKVTSRRFLSCGVMSQQLSTMISQVKRRTPLIFSQNRTFLLHFTLGTMPGAFPQVIRHGSPALGGRFTLCRKVANVFGAFQISGVSAGRFHHGRQRTWIIQQRAGTQMVFIERLSLSICQK